MNTTTTSTMKSMLRANKKNIVTLATITSIPEAQEVISSIGLILTDEGRVVNETGEAMYLKNAKGKAKGAKHPNKHYINKRGKIIDINVSPFIMVVKGAIVCPIGDEKLEELKEEVANHERCGECYSIDILHKDGEHICLECELRDKVKGKANRMPIKELLHHYSLVAALFRK